MGRYCQRVFLTLWCLLVVPGGGWWSVLKMMFTGAWLLLPYLQITRADESLSVTPARLRVGVGGAAELNCTSTSTTPGTHQAIWYKELQDGRLMHIPSPSAGKNSQSLVLKDVQQRDSGVYYCSRNPLINPTLSSRTQLLVSESAPTPSLSILVPSDEEAQPPETLVLLCEVSGVTGEWGPVRWLLDSREVPGETDAGSFDSQGVFSLRSLLAIPGESWRQGKECSCSITHNSTGQLLTAAISKDSAPSAGDGCRYVMYFGLPPCLLLLLVQLVLLIVCRERLIGRKKPPRVRLEVTETVYATTK